MWALQKPHRTQLYAAQQRFLFNVCAYLIEPNLLSSSPDGRENLIFLQHVQLELLNAAHAPSFNVLGNYTLFKRVINSGML
ncbi:hypothetical protein TNCV_4431691 [Trichonephila clavipes]|nr:hypothetical protein TNCV_4431691 [Trichonephila clavipes]